jgi:predicted nucleic acid-binding protein
MSDFLYDTCVFIDYWRGDPTAFTLIDSIRTGQASASYCTITATELWQYSQLNRREEIEYIALTKYFMAEAVITGNAAIQAGQWLRPYSRSRRRRLSIDALIAATAQERGEAIRTRNYHDIRLFYSNVQTY